MSKDDNRAMNDPRFNKVFSDPRFRSIKKKDVKVKLDDRFNKKDLKQEFTLLKSNAKVDKYGRKIKKGEDSNVIDNLDKYYENEKDEEEEEEEKEEESDSEKTPESEKDESSEEEEEVVEEEDGDDDDDDDEEVSEQEIDPLAKARGLVDNEDDTSEEEFDSSDEEISEMEDLESSEAEVEEIPELDPTTRIAAVNLDWDHLNSTDLFATFSSFLPKDGYIKSVSIYKSEYGKERISDEEQNGPPREIFKKIEKNESDPSEEEEDDDDEEEDDLDIEKASKKLVQENNGEEEGFDSSELRKYQLQRLRYYYAVIEFNNIESSKEIYKKCDNTEYESSGNFFDLRYIPVDMEFDESDIRDKCHKLPSNYQPIEFSTDSLRNSKPKLTWDETPIERVQMLSKSFKQGELDDLDLKNYLASDSEDDEANNNEDILKYKQLVGGLDKSLSNKNGKDEDDSEEDVDMEFTFTPSSSKTIEKKDKEEKSTIDKLREKEKERRKARKQKVKELKKDAQSNKKKNRSKKNDDTEKGEELKIENIGEENAELQHFNIKDVEKLEKLKSKKNKFKNKRQRELEKELESRLEGSNRDKLEIDDRFSEMIDSHAFVGGSKLLQQERKQEEEEEEVDLIVDNNKIKWDLLPIVQSFDRLDNQHLSCEKLRNFLNILLPLSVHSINSKSFKFNYNTQINSIIFTLFLNEENSSNIDEVDESITLNVFISKYHNYFPNLFDPLKKIFLPLLYEEEDNKEKKKKGEDTEINYKILNLPLLSQLSTIINIENLDMNINCKPLYQGSKDGYSINSIQSHTFNYKANTLLLVSGKTINYEKINNNSFFSKFPKFHPILKSNIKIKEKTKIQICIILTEPWKITNTKNFGCKGFKIIQLNPFQVIFDCNNKNLKEEYAYFSNNGSGLGFGSKPPIKSKDIKNNSLKFDIGGVSITIDNSLNICNFRVEDMSYQNSTYISSKNNDYNNYNNNNDNNDNELFNDFWFKINEIEIYGLGNWENLKDQKLAFEWEEREAERRRGLNKDYQEGRALLELAGIIGGGQSGGSM
ncbi:pre-rRNA-processing protein esf1 [Pichia californica]|uniref:Pre-rRNA-processing protein esf1 n=1 Tax=Pichia californica TaxID=460514 RepID=A0A9P6WQS3_9ASCO|nr:pre-rRNA-processing protein esf1 [[Candida] californica]